MIEFERNINVFGVGEPLLFPIKRTDQPPIHLARLLTEFFEFDGGSCSFYESNGEIKMKWEKGGTYEKWTFSENRGSSTPKEARRIDANCFDFQTLKNSGLVNSIRNLLSLFPNCKADLAKIIGIGGEGIVLEDFWGRLTL